MGRVCFCGNQYLNQCISRHATSLFLDTQPRIKILDHVFISFDQDALFDPEKLSSVRAIFTLLFNIRPCSHSDYQILSEERFI